MSKLTSITIPNYVTSIGNNAFSSCSGLTSIKIPNSVTSIGNNVFSGCSKITSVTWNAKNCNGYNFGNQVETFVFGDSVEVIPESLCSGMSKLTSITISNSVTSIGKEAFSGCSGITSITIPNGVTNIGNNAFSGCSNITSVVWNAKNCNGYNFGSQVKSFVLGNSVEIIPESLCYGMSKLTSITIPNSVTSIGNSAFSGCSGLPIIVISGNVLHIGDNAFNGVACVSYTGSAGGAPWGALLCGYLEDNILYNDVTKTEILYCLRAAQGEIEIPNSVISIGENAFSGCSGLNSITIPNSVTSIGKEAFLGCSGITSITIPNGVTIIGNNTFSGCSGITSITIPNGVTSIGNNAFSSCSGLTSIKIPNSVTSIGNNAFSGCGNITSVVWNAKNCNSYNFGAQVESYTFGNSVEIIPESLCYGMSKLTSIEIPNSVTSIGNSAFSGCSGLPIIVIPGNVLHIGDNAFNGVACVSYTGSAGGAPWGALLCGYLEDNILYNDVTKTEILYCLRTAQGEIEIPNSVISIGENAFSGCSSITSITIPNGVTSIGKNAFSGCNNITSVVWNAKNCNSCSFGSQVESFVFGDSVETIPRALCSGMTKLSSVTIPNSVTNIENGAFSSCSGLTSIEIPNSVTRIGNNAFNSCSGLNSITIPNSVTSIGDRAFYSCSSLLTVIIGNSVSSVGELAFLGCSSLTSLTIGNSVTILCCSAFHGCSSLNFVSIGAGVTKIYDNAFSECNNITSVVWNAKNCSTYNFGSQVESFVFGDSVEIIPKSLCSEMYKLTSITIGSKVTSIGSGVFSGCSINAINFKGTLEEWLDRPWASYRISNNYALYIGDELLSSAEIPESFTSIGKYAFYSCSSLNSITIPNSVTSIGDYAFYNCSSLSSIEIPNSVTSIGEYAFNGCSSLNFVSIGAGVTKIYNTVFPGCVNIRSVAWNAKNCNGYNFGNQVETFVFGDSVEVIPESLCSGMSKLTSITIPNSVTSIGKEAFYGCSRITSITIPNSVTNIGNNAFSGCVNIRSVAWNAKNCNGYNFGAQVESYTFGNSVEIIPESLCYGMSKLTSITIPDSVTSIGERAFSGCSNLHEILYLGGIEEWCSKTWSISSISSLYDLYFQDVKVTDLVIPNSITSIGNAAFINCGSLSSVTIPNWLTSIGNNVFSGCSNITSVTWNAKNCNGYNFGNQVETFVFGDSVEVIPESLCSGMSKLTSITIPDSVSSIGALAFSGCDGLSTIEIPNSVASIGENAFSGCGSLTSVILNSNDIVSKAYPYDDNIKNIFGQQVSTYVIGDDVTSIGDNAFYGCSSLTSVSMGNGITSIGASAFYNCSSLNSITIPNSVTSIEKYAFSRCSITDIHFGGTLIEWLEKAWNVNQISGNYALYIGNELLSSAEITNGVTSIGNYAFGGCRSLISITFDDGVTSIGDYAFSGCSSLTSVSIGNGVTSIGNNAFSGCSNLTSVSIGNGVTSIGENAFSGCGSLTSVILNSNDIVSKAYPYDDNIKNIFGQQVSTYIVGDDVTSIGERAFSGCSSLTNVIVPNSVKSIGKWAFSSCGSLTTFEIPSGAKSIGDEAFSRCSSLASVTIGGGITSIGTGIFYECNSLTDIFVAFCNNDYLSKIKRLLGNDSRVKYIPLPYSITTNATNGTVKSPINICDALSLTAVPDYGYHFVKWSDGNIDNPRNIELTQDTSFTAEFAINQYSIYVTCNETYGRVEGENGEFDYLTEHEYEAFANYGYHFVQWSDGVLDNPRTIVLTKNSNIIAVFAKNAYTITDNSNHAQGYIAGAGNYEYLDPVVLTPTPEKGYRFDHWSDGNIDNPRIIILTQDTTLEAIFALDKYTISTACDNSLGTIDGETGELEYLSEVTYTAVPAYGYHFDQWIDTIYLEVDFSTVITASQAYNIASQLEDNQVSSETYTIHGYVRNLYENYRNSYYIADTPDGEANFIIFKADKPANIGDHVLVHGQLKNYKGTTPETNSGALLHIISPEETYVSVATTNTNPRTIKVERDMRILAEFAKNQYRINGNTNGHGTVGGTGSFDYLSECTIQANPDYGYHFVQWSDGETNNPRTFVLTQDTTFTAEFAHNPVITYIYDLSEGSVSGDTTTQAGVVVDAITFEAIPNYGYHFVQWSDGNTDNPRTFVLTQDTTFTAEFAKNTYTISTTSTNPEWGTTAGDKSALYLDVVEITASSNYGYHFVKWNDDNVSNPRKVSVTEDKTYTATFAKNVYTITLNNAEHGTISGNTSAEYLDQVTLTANPEYGYHFAQWSDGNTENPRTIVLTQDTTFKAEFAIDRTGTCGNDNALTWTYDPETKTLTITGNGALNSNYTFGVEAPTQMQKLVIGNEITSIGDSAFYGLSTINHLVIGGSVVSIGDYAFAECRNFDDITCYATTVPTITENTFANVGNKQYIYLYVPEGRQRAYLRDTYWGEFDVQVKNAETVTEPTVDVVVTPSENSAEIVWPIVNEAETYEITITKDDQTVCTLTFNAQGQLIGIAFAPARETARQQQAEGFRFTITGLTSNTQYGYSIVAKDANNNTLDTKSGSFTTTGEIPTTIEDIRGNSLQCTKILRNDQIVILRGDKTYTLQGQEVK